MAKNQASFVVNELNKEKLKTKEGWMNFYDQGWLFWQSPEYSKSLINNLEVMLQGAKKSDARKEQVKCLVPLCGCSLDMAYLYDRGFTVLGVDFIEDSIKEFMKVTNNKFMMSKKTINDDYLLYESEDHRLKIFIGDFFKLTPEILGGKVDCIWDQKSLVAIDESFRNKYADVIKGVVNEDFGYLLYTIERENPPEQPTEWPLTLTYGDANELFKDFTVQLIDQEVTKKPKSEAEIDQSDPLCRRIEKMNTFLLSRKNARFDHWGKSWANNTIGWHREFVNPGLQKYFNDLTGGKPKLNFLFPLCGKSLDMKWVYEQGHTVIGVEGIVAAVEQFFDEAGIEYTRTKRPDFDCWVYTSSKDDGRLTIFVCDLFGVTPEVLGKSIDCTWDRGSYVALNIEDRKNYINLLLSFNSPQFKHLMETRQYDTSVYDGAPRNVDPGEIETFYKEIAGEKVRVTQLEAAEIEPGPRFNGVAMTKVLFMIEST